MAASSARPLSPIVRLLAGGLAALACMGLSCERSQDPPGPPSPVLTDIRVRLADPEQGTAGAALAWSDPGGKASYYIVYQSLSLDSLLRAPSAAYEPVKVESASVVLPLPNRVRPFTVYYAVRAVKVEATGQTLASDTLYPDSLTLNPSLSILAPPSGGYVKGRALDLQVKTQSDPGVALRLAYFEKDSSGWGLRADTCLPMDACGRPVFGPSVQRETLVLAPSEAGDTLPALFCVIGDESFQGRRTGLAQSLTCARFFRVAP